MGGSFSIGAPTALDPEEAWAPLTGSGVFSISDPLGHAISASLTLADVDVWNPGPSYGLAHTLNTVNVVNFSGYTGTDARLSQLNGRNAVFNLAFQFADPGPSLSDLMAPGSIQTTFNGTVSLVAIPEPSVSAVACSVAALACAARRFRRPRVIA